MYLYALSPNLIKTKTFSVSWQTNYWHLRLCKHFFITYPVIYQWIFIFYTVFGTFKYQHDASVHLSAETCTNEKLKFASCWSGFLECSCIPLTISKFQKKAISQFNSTFNWRLREVHDSGSQWRCKGAITSNFPVDVAHNGPSWVTADYVNWSIKCSQKAHPKKLNGNRLIDNILTCLIGFEI